jgi:hypothetical protein
MIVAEVLMSSSPRSPLLFNLVVDVFTTLLIKAARQQYLFGFMTNLYPGGAISLQYADDTLLFLSHDPRAAHHLKWFMIFFEKLSGMRINYHKSDLTPINLSEEEVQDYAKIFCCKIGNFSFTFLGSLFIMISLGERILNPLSIRS